MILLHNTDVGNTNSYNVVNLRPTSIVKLNTHGECTNEETNINSICRILTYAIQIHTVWATYVLRPQFIKIHMESVQTKKQTSIVFAQYWYRQSRFMQSSQLTFYVNFLVEYTCRVYKRRNKHKLYSQNTDIGNTNLYNMVDVHSTVMWSLVG